MPATASALLDIDVTTAPPPQAKGPWRFLYGPAQPAGGATAEVIQAQNRTITLRTGPDQFHEVSFDIDGLSPAAAGIDELQTDLIVMFGPQIVFCGRVVPTQDTLTASAHRTLVTALDYREVLRRRLLAYGGGPNLTAQDAADAAWDLIRPDPGPDGKTGVQGYPGGNLGIARGHGKNGIGTQRTINYIRANTAGDMITQLAQMTPGGFDWDITPYGMSDLRLDIWAPGRGTDRNVILEYGGGLVSSITRTVDPSAYANSVFVTGATTAGVQIANTPSAGSAGSLDASDIATRPEGRWDTLVGTQISTQSALDAYAMFALQAAEVLTPSYVITLYPGAWQGPDHIWLGDTVTVRIKSGRLAVNDDLSVEEMAFTISPDNVETLALTIGRLPFQLHRKIPRMLRRLTSLEAQ